MLGRAFSRAAPIRPIPTVGVVAARQVSWTRPMGWAWEACDWRLSRLYWPAHLMALWRDEGVDLGESPAMVCCSERTTDGVRIPVGNDRRVTKQRLFLSARLRYGCFRDQRIDANLVWRSKRRRRIRSMLPLPRRKPLLSAPRLDECSASGSLRAIITIVIVACHPRARRRRA